MYAIRSYYAIRFVNQPLGSTCTLVATLYRQAGIEPDPATAGLMLAGLALSRGTEHGGNIVVALDISLGGEIQVAAVGLRVITSYSIHYTKLYEMSGRAAR